jgi:predicted nucleic acid-binding protein
VGPMRSPTFLANPKVPLVADASTVINLIATGCAPSIVSAVPNSIVVAEVIPTELNNGRARGRKDADRLQELVSAGHVEIVSLGELGWQPFEELVAGPTTETLDDGEAATIAYAVEHGATAVLDEKKATRLCRVRFPKLSLASTVDILLHPDVRSALGEQGLGDALFAALRDARMRVFPHDLEKVVRLIGPERAALCLSLPKVFRTRVQEAKPVDVEERA